MKPLLLWLWLAQGADLATTGVALQRGCVEANPVLGAANFPVMVGVKGGVTVALTVTFGRQKPARKADKWVIASAAAAGTVGATLNARTLPRCGGAK